MSRGYPRLVYNDHGGMMEDLWLVVDIGTWVPVFLSKVDCRAPSNISSGVILSADYTLSIVDELGTVREFEFTYSSYTQFILSGYQLFGRCEKI